MMESIAGSFQDTMKDYWTNGQTSGRSQNDGESFEVYLDRLSSDALRIVSNQSPSIGISKFDLVVEKKEISSAVENAQGQSVSLGEKVLSGLYKTDGSYKEFLSYMDQIRESHTIDPLQVIMAQSLWMQASTAIEFTTRAVMKLSSVLDSMLRLQ